jgi:hypothetical protein
MQTISTLSRLVLLMALPAIALASSLSGDVSVRTTQPISSKTAKAGDKWTGTVARDLVRDGQLVSRRGANVEGVIDKVKPPEEGVGSTLVLRVTSIDGKPVESEVEQVHGSAPNRKALKKTIGWGTAGALIGAVLGGGKGAAIGAGAGAGIGGLRSLSQGKTDAVIASESVLTFQLR